MSGEVTPDNSYRSILVENLLQDAENGLCPKPAYFYCARNAAEPERADPERILRCIANQLSCLGADQPLPSPTRRLYQRRAEFGDLSSLLSLEDCTELIIALTADRPLTIIVLDALDECIHNRLDDLLDALKRIVRHSSRIIKIFVSSRNDHRLVHQLAELEDYLGIEIEATHNRTDISTFVRHNVDHLINKRRLLYGEVPDNLKERIVSVLCDKAQGM